MARVLANCCAPLEMLPRHLFLRLHLGEQGIFLGRIQFEEERAFGDRAAFGEGDPGDRCPPPRPWLHLFVGLDRADGVEQFLNRRLGGPFDDHFGGGGGSGGAPAAPAPAVNASPSAPAAAPAAPRVPSR